MTELTRKDVPLRPHTWGQLERIRDLAAFGPLTRNGIDDELDALRWTERYDGDETSTILKDGRSEMLYAKNGSVAGAWCPPRYPS